MQKDLGATLRQIAEGGAKAFYRGTIARAIARALEAQGGWVTEADLAGYRPTWGTPLAVTFRGHEVCVPPPPTNALQAVQTLQILEAFDLKGMGHNSVEYLHHFLEAAKIASADRVGLDVMVPGAPIAGLLAPRYAAERRKLLDPRRAGISGGERWSAERLAGEILPGHPADFAKEHTTHFAVADGHGTVVTVTQTLGSVFGSGVMVPGRGRSSTTSPCGRIFQPGSPAALRGGAPIQTRMAPTQVFVMGRSSCRSARPAPTASSRRRRRCCSTWSSSAWPSRRRSRPPACAPTGTAWWTSRAAFPWPCARASRRGAPGQRDRGLVVVVGAARASGATPSPAPSRAAPTRAATATRSPSDRDRRGGRRCGPG